MTLRHGTLALTCCALLACSGTSPTGQTGLDDATAQPDAGTGSTTLPSTDIDTPTVEGDTTTALEDTTEGEADGADDATPGEPDTTTALEDAPPSEADATGAMGDAAPSEVDATEAVGDVTPSEADTTTASEDATPSEVDATAPLADVTAEGEDSEEEDTGSGATVLDPCPATVVVTAPAAESFHVVGAPFIASAQLLESDGPLTSLSVRWETPDGTVMGETPVLPDGTTSGNLDTSEMPVGLIDLRARVATADGACGEATEVSLVFCQHAVSDDFEALDNESWKMFGSSYWDQGGWLEMTGTGQGQRGAVYNPQTDVAAGSVSIAFSMATGGGSGADGFAMTIVQTDSIVELESIIADALPGSGIGYGVGGAYGDWVGNAFTVEIDTYYNVFNGNNEFHTDPTPNDHIAITLDGDAGDHLWWTDVGEVEDLAWRTIQVDIIGIHVRVWIDGAMTVDQDFPELEFRGGYIFFSGSTGYYTNFHRFDDLSVIHTCQ